MKIKTKFIKVGAVLVSLSCLISWILFTNSGLRLVSYIVTTQLPYKIEYSAVSGHIIGQSIDFKDVIIKYEDNAMRIDRLWVDWRKGLFGILGVNGFGDWLPYSDSLQIDDAAVVRVVEGEFAYLAGGWDIKAVAHGMWQQRDFDGYGAIRYAAGEWELSEGRFKVGKNLVEVLFSDQRQYSWHLDLLEPQILLKGGRGAIKVVGEFDLQQDLPNLRAQVVADDFAMLDLMVKDVRINLDVKFSQTEPLQFDIKARRLRWGNLGFDNLVVSARGSYQKHDLQAKLVYDGMPFNLQVHGVVGNKVWDLQQIKLRTVIDYLSGTGKLHTDLTKGDLALSGTVLEAKTEVKLKLLAERKFNILLKMLATQENYLDADISSDGTNLSGKIHAKAQDLNLVMRWLPDVTRLKGQLSSEVNLAGTFSDPIITSVTKINNITATLPRLGVKIKPMELLIESDAKQRFNISGHGSMRRGPGEFTLSGFVEPFADDLPNQIKLRGSNMEFVNNDLAHLVASPDLNFNYDCKEHKLNVAGDLIVHNGLITYAKKNNNVVKSKDIVFVDAKSVSDSKQNLRINPNIFLRLEEGVRFIGFGLDTDVSGKLSITSKYDMLFGDGRITLKSGTYSLPGQNLHIDKGRIIYQPGSLLVNPMLDIKLYDKQENMNNGMGYKQTEIVIQGSAQQPQIYTNGLEGDQNKALSQALMTSSGLVSNNMILNKLKLSQIGVTNRDDAVINFFADPSKSNLDLKNKDLVIGRSLGRRFYVQYLHGLGDANQKVRMRYALSKNLFIGAESGTTGGGVDLSFSVERD